MTGAGNASSDGLASAVMHQSFAGAKGTIAVAGKSDADAAPTNIDVHADAIAADVSLDGVKSHALLDLWAFVVAHPTRPELAANEVGVQEPARRGGGQPDQGRRSHHARQIRR